MPASCGQTESFRSPVGTTFTGCAYCLPTDQAGRALDPESDEYESACHKLHGCYFNAGECTRREGSSCSVVPSRNASEVCIVEGKWRISDAGMAHLDQLCGLSASFLDETDIADAPKEFLRRNRGGVQLGPSNVITFDADVQRCVAHPQVVNIRSSPERNTSSATSSTELVLNCANEIIIPAYAALCICNPDDQQLDHCEWATPRPARFRVQVRRCRRQIWVQLLFDQHTILSNNEVEVFASTAHHAHLS